MGGPSIEQKLTVLDKVMLKTKRMQTRSDWEIELKRGSTRKWTIGSCIGWSAFAYFLTIDERQIHRMLRSPYFKPYMRSVLALPRFTMNGYPRIFMQLLPAWIFFCASNMLAERSRWNSYVKQDSFYGGLARFVDEGKNPNDDGDLDGLKNYMDDATKAEYFGEGVPKWYI